MSKCQLCKKLGGPSHYMILVRDIKTRQHFWWAISKKRYQELQVAKNV